jgi:UDP-N-acetylmuramyl tripeptide synthase
VSQRAGLAVAAGHLASSASRRLGRGAGDAIGGVVALKLDPDLLAELTAGRRVAYVSGTNGKTTTTCLLAAAVRTTGPVATNATGSNLPRGLVSALLADASPTAVLEVDEAHLPRVLGATPGAVVVLLNLSRDQLDRLTETRRLAAAWRQALEADPHAAVVANADDPLVVYAAEAAAAAGRVTWVAAGSRWNLDAAACPRCTAPLDREGGSWRCPACGLDRPVPGTWFEETEICVAGQRRPLRLGLPGRANRANAAMALTAARLWGVDVDRALPAVAAVDAVAGRYAVQGPPGRHYRLLLAKNPAGWLEALDILQAWGPRPGGQDGPVVVSINARGPDGRDTSWLWDVPFERLRGRTVVCAGERALDVALRLRYADVARTVLADPQQAIEHALDRSPSRGDPDAPVLDVVANYTAFHRLKAAP